MFDVSFPGFGIGPIRITRSAFEVFGKSVAWYGIIIAVAMVIAFFYARSRAKIEGVKPDDLIDYALFLMIFGVLGARLYYVLFKVTDYIATGGTIASNIWHTFVNIISVWNGGLAIFGGILAGFVTVVIVSKKKKIRLPVMLDMLAPATILAQGIGRWGNFMNGEAHGYETTLPWRMGLTEITGNGQFFNNYIEVHPTFLYESLWCVIGFVILHFVYKKKKFNGQIFFMYMAWYGLGRAVVEGFRTDSLYVWGTPVRVSQVIAGAAFIAGIVLLILNFRKLKKYNAATEPEIAEVTEESAEVIAEETDETENEAEITKEETDPETNE